MNTPRYAGAAARLIRQLLPSAGNAVGDEARGIATIERAMFARARQRRLRLLALGSSLAAAAGVTFAATQLTHSWRALEAAQASRTQAGPATAIAINATPSGQGAALTGNGGEEPLKEHLSIASGQRIDTPADGGASLQLSTGTSMTLAGRTSFRVDSQGATQRFTLQKGELVAHVAKLGSSQRFIVDTPDAEVEVRGTRFRLRIIEHPETCGATTRTRLEVSEGVVEVRVAEQATVSVRAGETWPADCAPLAGTAASAPPVQPPAQSSSAASNHAQLPRAATTTTRSEPERTSGLAAPNDLFALGVARARQGDTAAALRAYQDLMTRFPRSPLAENAQVERMRLLAESADGAAEAKRYLTRYPHGFATSEAKKLLAEP
ncbi:MAG TPA: FecR domain-containing protein [Polyangiaceae bacterium]|nr:FecR domain-containing protein [Polyangiaceae bacterium]